MANREIIWQFINGDIHAFESLFREYARGMQLTALALYQDADVAEDAVQESFVYLWEHRREIRPDMSVEGYLHTSVRHYVLNHIRHENIRRRREEDIIREQEWLGQASVDEEEWDARLRIVRQALDALPEACRKIFVMAVIEGIGYAATADELGVSVNTVKSQVKIAYKKLKEAASEYPDNTYITVLFLLSLQKVC